MKYYEELAKLQCFSLTQAESVVDGATSVRNLILDYKHKGYVESVKRNLYVLISLESKLPIANRYKIASSITEDSYVSHHSALEYYGCANQVYNIVYVSAKKKFKNFEYDDIDYSYIAARINSGVDIKENGIRVTSIERTILDCINDFEKISGIEEILRSILLIPYISEEKLLHHLKKYNKQFLYQKTGYILNHFKSELQLSDAFFKQCKSKVKESVRYLYNDIKQEENKYDNYWNLVVPCNLMDIISEGGYVDAEI